MTQKFYIALLFLCSAVAAQTSNSSTTTIVELENAFKIQERNYSLLEEVLAANTSDKGKSKPALKASEKGNFYNELRALYSNFKSANKNFFIADLTPEQIGSIDTFYKLRLAKLDSLYKLRDRSLRVTVQAEGETEALKNGQIPQDIVASYSEPSHESCKNPNQPSGESCISSLLRKHISRSYNIPEYRFSDEGISTTILIQFLITKNGEFLLTAIPTSSKYFEFDMEAILAADKFAKNNKFTPGSSNGKAVNVLYTCPITIKVAGE